MLEFIVLGRIPGTSIQFSFWQFIEICLLLSAIVLLWLEQAKRKPERKLRLQEIINRLAL